MSIESDWTRINVMMIMLGERLTAFFFVSQDRGSLIVCQQHILCCCRRIIKVARWQVKLLINQGWRIIIVINLAGQVEWVCRRIDFKEFFQILVVALVLNDEATEI